MHTPIQKSSEKAQLKANPSSVPSSMGAQHAAPPPFQLKAATAPHLEQAEAKEPEALQFHSEHDAGIVQWMPNDEGDSGSATPPPPTNNGNGLPQDLQSGAEALSGIDLSDVNVHYNSNQPAQYQAHAYAQGTDIHLGPGQEQHLPHEAWHVVQQKQGRVQPTRQFAGGPVGINDDAGLETEADVMGAKALAKGGSGVGSTGGLKRGVSGSGAGMAVQRKINGIDKVEKFVNSFSHDPTAFHFYQTSLEVRDFIKRKVEGNRNYKRYLNLHSPQTLNPQKPKGKPKLDSKSAYAKWVKALYWSFFEKEEGYDTQHASIITPKTEHNENWKDYVKNEIAQIPVNTTTLNSQEYFDKYQYAINAAKELDMRERHSDTMKTDLTNEQKAIRDFNKLVTDNRVGSDTLPMIPEWKTESKYGTGISMKAEYFPHSAYPKGSGENIKTPIDWFYTAKKEGVTARYVKGHLLNDHVGGMAKNYNLSPLRTKDNKNHESGIEYDLKQAVGNMQRLRRNNQPQTYSSILYEVELGAQTPRTATSLWTEAALFIENCKAQKATIEQVINGDKVKNDKGTGITDFSTVPNALIKLAEDLNLADDLTLKKLKGIFTERRLVWEMEDYLVRDWYVRLQINHADGNTEIQRLTLPNKKSNNPAEEVVRLDKTGAGFHWDGDTSRPGTIDDTSTFHQSRPLGLERELTRMSTHEYQLFHEYLSKENLATNFDTLPSTDNPEEIYTYINSIKEDTTQLTQLSSAITDFNNQPDLLDQYRKRRSKNNKDNSSNMLYLGGKPVEYTQEVLFETTGIKFESKRIHKNLSKYMGDRSSVEREDFTRKLKKRTDPDRKYDRGYRHGEQDGKACEPFEPESNNQNYLKGYTEAYYAEAKQKGKFDGRWQAKRDGRKQLKSNPNVRKNPYSDSQVQLEYKNGFETAYLNFYNSAFEAEKKIQARINQQSRKKKYPNPSQSRNNYNGQQRSNFSRKQNTSSPDKRKRNERQTTTSNHRKFMGNYSDRSNGNYDRRSGSYSSPQNTGPNNSPKRNNYTYPNNPPQTGSRSNQYNSQRPQPLQNIPQHITGSQYPTNFPYPHQGNNIHIPSQNHQFSQGNRSNGNNQGYGFNPSGPGNQYRNGNNYGHGNGYGTNNGTGYGNTPPPYNPQPMPNNPQQGYGNTHSGYQYNPNYNQTGYNGNPQPDPYRNNNNFPGTDRNY